MSAVIATGTLLVPASLLASAPSVGRIVAAAENGFVAAVAERVNYSDYLNAEQRVHVQQAVRYFVSPRAVADSLWKAMICSDLDVRGIELQTGSVSRLVQAPGTYQTPELMRRAGIERAAPTVERLQELLDREHAGADWVGALVLSADEFLRLTDVGDGSRPTVYSLLVAFDPMLRNVGLQLTDIDDTHYKIVLQIPSLSLIEAMVRVFYGRSLRLVSVAGEMDAEKLEVLWRHDKRPVGQPLDATFLANYRRKVAPLLYTAHDLYHVIEDFQDNAADARD